MPLPLIIPFLVKGAIVALKAGAAKGALVQGAMVTKSAIATYGVATTATTILTGTTIIGGFVWAGESIDKATKAYELYEAGDKLAAAEILVSLAANIKSLGSSDLASDLQSWMDAGQPVSGAEFSTLVKDVYVLSKEAKKALEDR